MKRLRRKIQQQEGFSLAETLVVLIIILLVSAIVAGAMPAAKNAYFNVLESANAQVFLSTTLTEFRNELSTAGDIKISSASIPQTITYTNPITGKSEISFNGTDGTYQIKTYLDLDTAGKVRPMVPKAARTNSLRIVKEPVISYADNVITIATFEIQSTKTDSVVAKLEKPYYIRVIAEPDATPAPAG